LAIFDRVFDFFSNFVGRFFAEVLVFSEEINLTTLHVAREGISCGPQIAMLFGNFRTNNIEV